MCEGNREPGQQEGNGVGSSAVERNTSAAADSEGGATCRGRPSRIQLAGIAANDVAPEPSYPAPTTSHPALPAHLDASPVGPAQQRHAFKTPEQESLLEHTVYRGSAGEDVINFGAVLHLLQEGVNPNVRGTGEQTPLDWAAWRGFTKVVEELLKAGAAVDPINLVGQTPLYQAAAHGRAEAVHLLLDAGARTAVWDVDGLTPLMKAAQHGHTGAVAALLARVTPGGALKYDVLINARDKQGVSALMWAASFGHLEAMNELLKAGASIDLTDKNGFTALTWAAKYGHIEAMSTLLGAGVDPNMARPPAPAVVSTLAAAAPSSLKAAASSRHAQEVSAAGAAGGEDGAYGCYAACAQPDYPAGCTALMLVGERNRVQAADFVRLLLDHGARLNAADERGWTPVTWAAAHGSIGILEALIRAGAETDVRDQAGVTPLMAAAHSGQAVAAAALLRAGADAHATDKAGFTALDWARRYRDVQRVLTDPYHAAKLLEASDKRLAQPQPSQSPSQSTPPGRNGGVNGSAVYTCPLCEAAESRWALLTCGHRGPCEDCCPTAGAVAAAYPVCAKCGAATDAAKVHKLRLV